MTNYTDTKVNINKIKVDESRIPPDDPNFMPIFISAVKKEIKVCKAIIKAEGVKPFSLHFRPILTESDHAQYKSYVDNGQPHFLHVYKQEDKFIMSDDYFGYTFYIEAGYTELPCLIMGNSESEFVIKKGEEFFYSLD